MVVKTQKGAIINPKLMEAWFKLLAEATKGTGEAQEAFRALGTVSSGDTEAMSRWLAKFMPAAMASASNLQPEAFEAWVEESWRMMGVVPRERYLELLEKHDLLQRRLEKAEDTIKKLRSMLDTTSQQEEAQKVMDLWGSMLSDTLKLQADWMQSWTTKTPEEDQAEKSSDDEPGDK